MLFGATETLRIQLQTVGVSLSGSIVGLFPDVAALVVVTLVDDAPGPGGGRRALRDGDVAPLRTRSPAAGRSLAPTSISIENPVRTLIPPSGDRHDMTNSTGNDYHLVVDLQNRFRKNGEDEQVAFCDKILDRLERADGS